MNSGKAIQCPQCGKISSGQKKRKDLTGKKFGYLTITKMLYNYNNSNKTYCECKCDCGKTNIIKNVYNLANKSSEFTSCGCQRKNIAKKYFYKDITKGRYGRLNVINTFWDNDASKEKCECKCDCGNFVICAKSDIMSGHTKSCGCLQRERISKSNYKDWTNYISDSGGKAIQPLYQNNKGQWIWEYECPLCHEYFNALPAKVNSNHTTSCGYKIKSSRERLITNYLEKNNVYFIPQYKFEDCKDKYVLKFDFALLNKEDNTVNYLIEYDGEQHYKPVELFGGESSYKETVKRDNIKNEYCKKYNIPLLRLKYDLTDKQIKEKIANII